MGKRSKKKAANKAVKKLKSKGTPGLPKGVSTALKLANIARGSRAGPVGAASSALIAGGGMQVKRIKATAQKGSFASRHPVLTTVAAGIGGAAVGTLATKFLSRKVNPATGLPMRRSRASVPKTVRKWVTKTVSKRKQQDKMLRKMLSASGASRLMGAKRAGSRGVITAQEASNALRR